MNLCLNAFVIQSPDDLLDTCLVTAPRALLLPFTHMGHCKDEDSYKECSSRDDQRLHLTRIRRINLQMHVKMKIHGQILFSTGFSRFPSVGEPYVPDR